MGQENCSGMLLALGRERSELSESRKRADKGSASEELRIDLAFQEMDALWQIVQKAGWVVRGPGPNANAAASSSGVGQPKAGSKRKCGAVSGGDVQPTKRNMDNARRRLVKAGFLAEDAEWEVAKEKYDKLVRARIQTLGTSPHDEKALLQERAELWAKKDVESLLRKSEIKQRLEQIRREKSAASLLAGIR